jgi:hypothetical protein
VKNLSDAIYSGEADQFVEKALDEWKTSGLAVPEGADELRTQGPGTTMLCRRRSHHSRKNSPQNPRGPASDLFTVKRLEPGSMRSPPLNWELSSTTTACAWQWDYALAQMFVFHTSAFVECLSMQAVSMVLAAESVPADGLGTILSTKRYVVPSSRLASPQGWSHPEPPEMMGNARMG